MSATQVFDYDVIVVGGGPAGLAVASELSKKWKVLVADKRIAGKTHRSWFIPYDAIPESVIPFAYGGVKKFITRTFTGAHVEWEAELFKDRKHQDLAPYPYIDEEKLLPHWVNVIRQNGSDVRDGYTYFDSVVDENSVTVAFDCIDPANRPAAAIDAPQGNMASASLYQVVDSIVKDVANMNSVGLPKTRKTVRARLLIDASGYNSLIVQKYQIKRSNYYWWSVCGCIGEHPNGLNGMKVGDYQMWQTFADTNIDINTSMAQGRPVLEYEILSENKSFTFIFYLKKERMPAEYMAEEYMRIIREEPTTANFHDMNIKELKYGWYPSGTLSQQIAEDRVAFVGDAGCWTTPCGWGMTFILRNFEYFSAQMNELLAKDTLDKKSLLSVPQYTVHAKYQILLSSIETHFLSVANALQLDKFIKLFRGDGTGVPYVMCEKIFTLSVTHADVIATIKALRQEFTLEELLSIFPKEDYLLMLETVRYAIADIFVDGIKILLNRHPDYGVADGFNFTDDDSFIERIDEVWDKIRAGHTGNIWAQLDKLEDKVEERVDAIKDKAKSDAKVLADRVEDHVEKVESHAHNLVDDAREYAGKLETSANNKLDHLREGFGHLKDKLTGKK